LRLWGGCRREFLLQRGERELLRLDHAGIFERVDLVLLLADEPLQLLALAARLKNETSLAFVLSFE
jgi:hypothetical protein